MPTSITRRHDLPQEDVIDFFICAGGPRPAPTQDSAAHDERIASAELPHEASEARQATDVATRLSMERHGWKQTGKTSSLWAFEHRWPHLRDHAEGRNHRLPSS